MKKWLAFVLALTMGLTLLSSCGAKAPSSGNLETDGQMSDVTIELEFIQWWSAESGGEYLDQIIADFEKENPNIKIKLVTLPFGEVRNQIIASQATKTVPDLLAMNPPWTREFYDLGILAPLDDLMAADSDFGKEDYFPASFTPIEGNTYLMPVNALAFYLYYNKDMFEAAGLEPPTTWEEIVSSAKALTNPDKNEYGFTITMAEQEASNGSILFLYPLLYAQNGRTFVDGKYTVETDEMRAALNLLDQMNKDGSILPGTTTKSEVQMIEEFSVGNIGMMISNDGHLKTVSTRNPDLNFGIVPIPSVDGSTQPELRHHGWDIAISENCEHKEEAWEFISYLCSKPVMEAYCDAAMKLPAAYGVNVDYLNQYPVAQDALNIMNEYNMVEELMVMPKASACWVDLTKAGSAVLQGAKTVDEALTETQALWDEKLGQ